MIIKIRNTTQILVKSSCSLLKLIYLDIFINIPKPHKNEKNVENFGEFKADSINLTMLGVNNPVAVKLMDRAGWR